MRGDSASSMGLKASKLLLRDIVFYVLLVVLVTGWVQFFIMTSIDFDDPETAEDESWSEETKQLYFTVCVLGTASELLIIFFWRYRTWAGLVKHGVAVPGKVFEVRFAGFGGVLIDVVYQFEGMNVLDGKVLGGILPRMGRKVSKGDEVSLLVHGRNPRRYIILDLFMDRPGA